LDAGRETLTAGSDLWGLAESFGIYILWSSSQIHNRTARCLPQDAAATCVVAVTSVTR
jgi:hypothetical protein